MYRMLMILTCAAFLAWTMPAGAAEPAKTEKGATVKLEGTIVCTKCSLKETKKCGNAIQVKEGGKTLTYYFDDNGGEADYHGEICGGEDKAGTVTGTVTEKDGKKFIKPSKVEYAKK